MKSHRLRIFVKKSEVFCMGFVKKSEVFVRVLQKRQPSHIKRMTAFFLK